MSSDIEAFQALLARMRMEFIDELPERCDRLDELIMTLEKSPDNRDAFNELFRTVHSLKGSGGTHGLSIITTLCHQLENILAETDAQKGFGASFATRALSYVDLLRKIETLALQNNPNFASIESSLDNLRLSTLQSRRTILIAESSPTMAAFYKQVLGTLPLQLSLEDNGLTALARLLQEPFDILIAGREIKELNGLAMMAALRHSESRNQSIPAILVSSKLGAIPEHIRFSASLSRDRHLADNLLVAVTALLKNGEASQVFPQKT